MLHIYSTSVAQREATHSFFIFTQPDAWMSHLSLKIATTISMQLKAAQTTHATIIIWQSLPTSPEVLVSSCFSKCAFSPPTLCFRHFTANCLQYLCSCHLYLSHILECIRRVISKPKVNVKHNSVYITQPNFAVEKRRKSFSEFSKSYRLGVISFDPLSEVKTDLQSPGHLAGLIQTL